MADVFQARRGFVAVIGDTEGLPGRVRVDGFAPSAAIIESINFQQAENLQFQTSLEDAVYIYVFGSQMGAMIVNGVAFTQRCPGNGETGVKEVLDFYDATRAAQRKDVVTVEIGSKRFSGFLTEMILSPRDPELQLSNFSLKFAILPRKRAS